jgi:LIVCS family branched-chain amino acid:cation transporter
MLSKSIIAGFAIFSMIFGSGNIVFPLVIGRDYSFNLFTVLCGWLAAAVIIPMGGYYGAMLYGADNKKYLAPIGKYATFILMFLIMMIVGPFGVMARIVNVAFGGVYNLAPQFPLAIFSFIYTALMVYGAFNPGKLVHIIGAVFTPLKFGGILAVVIIALICGGAIPSDSQQAVPIFKAFYGGFNTGYQTMDLLASLMAAMPIYLYIKEALPKEVDKNDNKQILKFAGWACIVGGTILAIAYTGLTTVGAQYATSLADVPNEALFGKVAELSMGYYASWVVAIVIAVSCLATSTMLCSIFTDYVKKDLLCSRGNRNIILISVAVITYVISLLGFQQICDYLGLILEKIYPILTIFIVIKIVLYYVKQRKKK